MKKITSLFLVAAIAFAMSCSRSSTVKTSPGSPHEIGKIDGAGNHTFSANLSVIKSQYMKGYKMTSIEDPKVYRNGTGLLIMETKGTTKTGSITLATVLTVAADGTTSRGACTQSCTTVAPCEGCALNVMADCSGSCSCPGRSGANCTHTVTTGDGTLAVRKGK